jgi:hypothetical protein
MLHALFHDRTRGRTGFRPVLPEYRLLETKFGPMPCECSVLLERSYITGNDCKAASDSGFFLVWCSVSRTTRIIDVYRPKGCEAYVTPITFLVPFVEPVQHPKKVINCTLPLPRRSRFDA